MSDTPRTDAAEYFASDEPEEKLDLVDAGFARQLEHELTAAQAEIARLKAGGCARDQRTTQFCGEALKLQERIETLENEKTELQKQHQQFGDNAFENALSLVNHRDRLQEENARLQERVKRLEVHGSWIPASTKPKGWERKVLCWVVWPACGWPAPPEAIIGWWKHGPGCFAVVDIECADHLVTHWMEITDPSEAKDTQ